MRILIAALAALVLLAGRPALAQAYAALGGDNGGVSAGPGLLLISGKNGAGSHQSVLVPTLDLSGLSHALAWQVFYSLGNGPTLIGGAADYIFAGSGDDCAACANSAWWFGAGPSVIHLEDIFANAAGVNKIGESIDEGLNLGGGWTSHSWDLEARAHYLFQDKMLIVQASVNKRF